MESVDIAIGGGGIIGLTAALDLAQAGFHVKVLERGQAMAEASWAAAGMLAAEDPENPSQLAPLAALSRDLYPEYLHRIKRLSGREVRLRTRYALQATRRGGSFHCTETATRLPISAQEAERRIPGLSPGDRALLWLEESSLDPRDLCAALPLAATAAGVDLEQQTEVLAVDAKAASVTITTSRGAVSAGAFVNCCGAWASSVPGAPPMWSSEVVEPRKGQIVVIRPESAELAQVLRTPDFYLVPRGDGRIALGATVERVGFDRNVDPAAVKALLGEAASLWLPIASASIVESWAGLRPGTSDDLPLIGAAGPNCWLATGHFRNGILLAPGTGRAVRQLIVGEPPTVPLDAFSPERMSSSPLPGIR